MKTERFIYDDLTDTATVVQSHDVNPVLDQVRARKSAGLIGNSEKRHVATVPFALIETWCREAGVRFDDADAVKELMHRKLQSGEFSALRLWEGRY